jgi:hypothetical protein
MFVGGGVSGSIESPTLKNLQATNHTLFILHLVRSFGGFITLANCSVYLIVICRDDGESSVCACGGPANHSTIG